MSARFDRVPMRLGSSAQFFTTFSSTTIN
jgi:hypothetical protein